MNNVVTLSTPHQGVADAGPDDTQWKQMQPGSDFLDRLHAKHQLDDAWADGTDWSLVGSHRGRHGVARLGDRQGRPRRPEVRLRRQLARGEVTHTGVRTLFGSNDYHLT